MVCTFPRRYSTQILKELVLESRVLEPILLKPEFHLALLNSLTLGSHGDIPYLGFLEPCFPTLFETLGMFYKLLEQLIQCIQTVLIICLSFACRQLMSVFKICVLIFR